MRAGVPTVRMLMLEMKSKAARRDRGNRPTTWVASSGVFRHGAGESEVGEHAAVGEEGDLGDVAARECEHEQPVRARNVCLRAREVAAEGGLTVGAGWHEPQRRLVARAADAQEVPIAAPPWYRLGAPPHAGAEAERALLPLDQRSSTDSSGWSGSWQIGANGGVDRPRSWE
jgi:hypothetical protein